MKKQYKIKRVTTLQANRKGQLRRTRWLQAFTLDGLPLTSPQPTAALCRSAIHSAYKT